MQIIKYNIYIYLYIYIYLHIYKFPTIDLKKIIKYKIYFKYMLNMVDRVGFGGFVIL